MRRRTRVSVSAVVPLVLLLLSGCGDEGPVVPAGDDSVPLQLSANLSGTPIATLAVEVTAADIVTPLAYNLSVLDGAATGSIQVPPGTARTITVRAFDSDGSVTHEGSVTVDVVRGNNPPVHIALIPRSGHQPIDVTLAEVGVVINPPEPNLLTGETIQLEATVLAAGEAIDVTVGWATLNPAVASVSADGLVNALAAGSAVIVATYAGVGGATTVTVLSGGEVPWYADLDADGYGDPGNSVFAALPPAGYVADGTDCDDTNAMTNPDATEVFDGLDNDCDGMADELPWYPDVDGDGWGDESITVWDVVQPVGHVGIAGDCDDASVSTYPGAPELIDGVDNDCDAVIDELG